MADNIIMSTLLISVVVVCALFALHVEGNNELDDIKAQLRLVVEVNRNLQSSLHGLQSRFDIMERKYRNVETSISELITTNNNLQKTIDNLENDRQMSNAKLIQMQKEIDYRFKHTTENNTKIKPREERSGDKRKYHSANVIRRLLLPPTTSTQSPSQRVAFFVRVSGDVSHLGDNQIVPMKMVVIDTANAFHPDIGTFVSPNDGLFAFFVTMTAHPDQIQYEVVKNGVAVAFGVSENQSNSWASSSLSAIIQLSIGDHVYVRIHGSGHADVGESIGSYSHFMGFSLM